MKKMLKVLQTLVIALIMSVTLWGNPWMVSPAAAQVECDASAVPLLRENGWVMRMNVPDQQEAMYFYENIMGLTCNPTFFSPGYWAEFYSEDDPNASIGLSSNPYEPFEPKTVTTQIVPDLAAACMNLKQNGVPIEHSEYVGFGVCLASFQDFSGNQLAYRQEKWDSQEDAEKLCHDIIEQECSLGF